MDTKKGKNENLGLLIQPFEKATVSYRAIGIENYSASSAPFNGNSFTCLQGAFKVFTNVNGTICIKNLKQAELFIVTIESGREKHCHIAVYKTEVRVLPNYIINENGVTQKFMFNQQADYLAEMPDVPEFTVHLKQKNYCQRVDIVHGNRPASIIIVGLGPLMVRFNGDYACHRIKKLLGLSNVRFSGGFDVYEKREDQESSEESEVSGPTNSEDSDIEEHEKEKPKKKTQMTVQATVPAGYLEIHANKRFSEIEVQDAMMRGGGNDGPIDFPQDVAPIIRKVNPIHIRKRSVTSAESGASSLPTPAAAVEDHRKKLEMPKEDQERMRLARERRIAKGKAQSKEAEAPKTISTSATTSMSATTSKPPSVRSRASSENDEKSEVSKTSKKSSRRAKEKLNTLVNGLASLIIKLQTEPSSDEE